MTHPLIRDGWCSEIMDGTYGQTWRVTRHLVDESTPFQKLDVIENDFYGKILLLDGCMMLTERDEFVYHEMITHIPLLAHPRPERVLVIGGGDGGTIREVVRHPEVKEAVLCEIDGRVIEVCREHFPRRTAGLDDPRVRVVVADGIPYIEERPGYFDLILIDSTDPVGPALGLFRREFYAKVRQALRPGGIMVNQAETPFLHGGQVVREIAAEQRASFGHVAYYWACIHTYPNALWLFGFCSDTPYDRTVFDRARAARIAAGCRYFTPELQQASFALPGFVRELVQE